MLNRTMREIYAYGKHIAKDNKEEAKFLAALHGAKIDTPDFEDKINIDETEADKMGKQILERLKKNASK